MAAASLHHGTHAADARLYNLADIANYLRLPAKGDEDEEATFSFRDLVARFLRAVPTASDRIDTDEAGVPIRLHPFTRENATVCPRLIVLDPRVRFGRPCLAGTNTPAEDVAERFHAGESLQAVCADLAVSPSAAEEAVRYAAWLWR